MGLSNQERYSKILWTVKNIEDQLSDLSAKYENKKLKSFAGKLWPALLNKEGNSMFWVFGGGFNVDSFDGGFLSEALRASKPQEKDDWFDDSENYIENNLRLCNIIGEYHSTESTVVEIYQWIENFYYAVNRYDDEFSAGMPELKSVVANLKGELFNIISADKTYLRGYLLHKIFDKCIDKHDKNCPLTKLINEDCLFHNFKLQKEEYHKTEDLLEAWAEIQFQYQREIPLSKRILLVLSLMGRRVGESYQQNSIKKSISEFVSEENLQEVLNYCSEQRKIFKQIEEENSKSYRENQYCSLTEKY